MNEPFSQMPHRLIDDGLIALAGASGFAVLAVLRRHADGNGLCFPGILSIAMRTGLSRQTVRRSIAHLEEIGVIRVERTIGKAHCYHLVDPYQNCLGTSAKSDRVPVPNLPGDPYQNCPLRRNREKETKKKGKSKDSSRHNRGYSREFLEWFGACPKRDAKYESQNEYDKAIGYLVAECGIEPAEAHRILIDGIKAYSETINDAKYALSPKNWLNQRRWEDELPRNDEDQLGSDTDALMASLSAGIAEVGHVKQHKAGACQASSPQRRKRGSRNEEARS